MLLLQTPPKPFRFFAAVISFMLLASVSQPVWPDDPPSMAVFVQYGRAEHADSIALGAIWPLGWRHERPCCVFTSSIEATVGRWSIDSGGHVTKFGIIPAVRLERPGPSPRWFLEFGVGANIISPTYRNRDRHFSTALNFSEYLAAGRAFGARREHELILRVEHFSNAGLDSPNPGENFIQFRYQKRF